MNLLLNIWNKLSYLGIDRNEDGIRKEILFLNRYVICQFIIILSYIPIEFLFLNPQTIPAHLLYGSLSLFCLYLNSKQRFDLSKFYFMILMNLNIFYWVLESGGTTQTEFFYVSASLFGFLLFRKNQWIVIGQMILSIVLFFLALKLTETIPPLVDLKDGEAEKIAVMSNIILFIIIFIIIRNLSEAWSANRAILKNKKNIIEQKNIELNDSINYAEKIQKAIIPNLDLIEDFITAGFTIFKPKENLSGDFSFFHKQSSSVIWVAAADCTGHGVPGSLVSVLGVNILHKAIVEKGLTQPNQVLDFATEEMEENLNRFSENIIKDGMDISLLRIEKINDEFKINYAGANNPFWLLPKANDPVDISNTSYRKTKLNNSALVEVPANRQPIGNYFKRTAFVNHEFTVQSGCRIYLFSDGYVDQFGGKNNKKITKARFRNLFLENYNESMPQQKKLLEDFLLKWSAGFEQVDDILVIGIEL